VKLKGNQFVPKARSIPLVGFGTFQNWKKEKTQQTILSAIQVGYTHFDCSPFHENEELVGTALAEFMAANTNSYSREDFFISSKLFNNCHEVDRVESACRKSLKDLQIETLDLYLMQSPIAWKFDYKRVEKDGKSEFTFQEINVPLEQTWSAMEALVEKGLVKHLGVSNFNLKELEQLVKIAKIPVSVVQLETHPYNVEKDLVEFCTKNRIHVTARTPLGGSAMNSMLENETVVKLAKNHVVTAAQVVLRWNVNRGVSVIPNTVAKARMEENQNIFEFEFTQEEQVLLDTLDQKFTFGTEPWKK